MGTLHEERWYFRLAPQEIAYVRSVVESYEGLAQVTSFPGRAEVEWVVPAGQEEEAEALRCALGRELRLVRIPRPEDWPQADGTPRP
ncbi:MAG: DUF4911 domain-containing protein [Deltaproteobacteria bacterium]|nr:DUF4911 domain-containing protein [Deltaproteobacteria bacterium]